MQAILDAPPLSWCPRHATYVNDVHLAGCSVADTWRNTLEAIRRLTRRGIINNAWNLQLLMQWVSILGYELVQDVFQLGRSHSASSLAVKCPRMITSYSSS